MNNFQIEFEKCFFEFKNKTIALYGLGKTTFDILKHVSGYSFVIVAADHIGEIIDGYEVYPIQDAVKLVDAIIITALPKSVKTIYNRINTLCPENIDIMDLSGSNLRELNQTNDIEKIRINSFEDLGLYIFSPVFILMLEAILKKNKEESPCFLFSSRDCYLLHSILKELYQDESVSHKYIYVSRRALTVAQIERSEDIDEILNNIFSFTKGNLLSLFEERFGIPFNEDIKDLDVELNGRLSEEKKQCCKQIILKNMNRILENASLERKHYQSYINSLCLDANKKYYFVDLVTRGTNYEAFKKITGMECSLFCLGYKTEDISHVHLEKVESIYPNITRFSKENLARYYQLLEIAFSASEGQLVKVYHGQPIFEEDTEYSTKALQRIQTGIKKSVELHLKKSSTEKCHISLEIADFKLGLLDDRYSVKAENLKEGFDYYDRFSAYDKTNIWEQLI